jgi:hypothetical protein
MKQYLYFVILIVAMLMLVLNGCMVYSTLQDAKTLEPGEVILGGGAAFPIDNQKVGVFPEIAGRVGIVKKFDAGIKYSAPQLIFIDGKYQILDGSVYLSADLGWSYFSYNEDHGLKDKGTTTAWYPMLIVGQDHWYAAVKKVYFMTEGEFEFFGSQSFEGAGWLTTNITLGGILGSSFRVIPEINIIIPRNGSTLLVPALGFQFKL